MLNVQLCRVFRVFVFYCIFGAVAGSGLAIGQMLLNQRLVGERPPGVLPAGDKDVRTLKRVVDLDPEYRNVSSTVRHRLEIV